MKTSTPLRIILGATIIAMMILTLPPAIIAGNNIEEHIIETETGIYYIVQPGDTLWDLSQQFTDSPYLWPDMWNENQQITNPHLIYPGDRIKLYRRTDQNKIKAGVPGPEPAGKMYSYSDIDAVGFIRKQALAPSGTIVDVKRPKELLSDHDEVYIATEQDQTFNVGAKYTVYRTLKEIRDNQTRAYIGIQHFLLGVVEITQVTQDVIIGKVVKSFRAMAIGDKVTPYLKRPAEFEIKDSVPGLTGKLIATEEHLKLIAQHRTAFIDKGEADGVEVGQYYTIFIQRQERINSNGRKREITLPPQKMGSVLVLHTEENTATTLIVQSEPGIDAWTPIGTPF